MAALSCLLACQALELLKETSLAWEFRLLLLKLGSRDADFVLSSFDPWGTTMEDWSKE